jgi:hypothetical protein
VRRRKSETAATAAPVASGRKSGDLTQHLDRQAAADVVPADVPEPQALPQEPSGAADTSEPQGADIAFEAAPTEASVAEALDEAAAPAPETTFMTPVLTIVHSEPDAKAEEPQETAAEPFTATAPVVVPITPSVVPHVAPAPDFTDIAAYWRSLCGELVYPAVSAIDRDFVSKRWPGTLMISFARSTDYPSRHPSIGGVTRLGTSSPAMQEAIDSGSYAIEWMIEVGRAAIAAAAPLEELQRLPTRAGSVAFRLLALPLGAHHTEPDTVLCQLAPATAAPRFGKRRNWLAA